MRNVACALAGVLLGLPGVHSAEDKPTPRFQLVTAGQASQLERRLQSAAASGYTLVAAAQGTDVTGRPRITALMEHSGADAAPRTYRVLACSGNLRNDPVRTTLAGLGSRGYSLSPNGITVRKMRDHWLPDSANDDQMTLILERATAGARYAFDSLAFGDYEPFYRDLRERRSDGYEVVGMWSTGRRLQVILQKRTDDGASDGGTPVRENRFLFFATRLVLAGKLATAARDGFRVLAADDPTITGPPLMLLEKTAAPENRIEYKFLDDVPTKQTKDKLEKKLNRRAQNGWRVAERGSTAKVITLQRPARKEQRTSRTEYLLLSSRRAPGLARSLEDATKRGFEFVRLFVEPDETTVLLEKTGVALP